jgi:Ser/Thr protein kinase RdoA (MazF antagonist)
VPTPLPDLLRAHHVASGAVEQAIFGTTDADVIAGLIAAAAGRLLGAPVEGGLFYAASSGCVFGLRLADGRSVVLKAYQARWERSFLAAVQRVQGGLAGRGFPCPTPLAGPVAVGDGWATVESFLPDPGSSLPRDGEGLEASAAALVRLLQLARGLPPDDLERHPFRIAEGELYPTPHSPIFDLRRTGAGAEWIDEWAELAWSRRSAGSLPAVIAYLDWSARNVRLAPTGVVAVYDWDSLSMAPEAVAAGQAAATWRSTGETLDRRAPDAEEIERFIASFGHARSRPFTAAETEVARAAAVWVMAYSARCEHALEQRTEWRRNRARDWLRSQAEVLLR